MTDSTAPEKHGKILFSIGIVVSLIHLWMNTLGTLSSLWQNAIHFATFIVMAGFMYPLGEDEEGRFTFPVWLEILLTTFAGVAVLWLVYQEDAIYERGLRLSGLDVVAICYILLVITEYVRRTTGWVIPCLILISLSYVTWLGPLIPGVMRFSGLNFDTVLFRSLFGDDALLGSIATISSSFVFMFILFGAFLLRSGGGDFIIELSRCVADKMIGGPGFVAIFSSALTGMISGSAVANTASTGVITIPLMKKAGFNAKFAGGVEAAASTGGQLMPPIMGAGAFVMASVTQLPYSTIVIYSILPAILYFATVGFFVYLEARKHGIKQENEQTVTAWQLLKMKGWAYILPIAILIGLLIVGYTPTYAAGLSIVAVIFCSWFTPERMTAKRVLEALSLGARNMVFTAIIMLGVGLIVSGITTTGVGNTFSLMIAEWSDNNMLIAFALIAVASLILGMGLPVTASYIVLGTLSAPVLYKLLSDQYLLQAFMEGQVTDTLKAVLMLSAPELVAKLGQPLSSIDASALMAAIPPDFMEATRDELLPKELLASCLLAAHLVIFWLSQDSNVTPPVCLVAFTAAAIAGSRPMETGVQAWKIAKGLYIIPLLFLYGPLITGTWFEIFLSAAFALFGLYAFTAAFQGFLNSDLSWLQRVLVTGISFLLLWPGEWLFNSIGLALLLAMINLHRFLPKLNTAKPI